MTAPHKTVSIYVVPIDEALTVVPDDRALTKSHGFHENFSSACDAFDSPVYFARIWYNEQSVFRGFDRRMFCS